MILFAKPTKTLCLISSIVFFAFSAWAEFQLDPGQLAECEKMTNTPAEFDACAEKFRLQSEKNKAKKEEEEKKKKLACEIPTALKNCENAVGRVESAMKSKTTSPDDVDHYIKVCNANCSTYAIGSLIGGCLEAPKKALEDLLASKRRSCNTQTASTVPEKCENMTNVARDNCIKNSGYDTVKDPETGKDKVCKGVSGKYASKCWYTEDSPEEAFYEDISGKKYSSAEDANLSSVLGGAYLHGDNDGNGGMQGCTKIPGQNFAQCNGSILPIPVPRPIDNGGGSSEVVSGGSSETTTPGTTETKPQPNKVTTNLGDTDSGGTNFTPPQRPDPKTPAQQQQQQQKGAVSPQMVSQSNPYSNSFLNKTTSTPLASQDMSGANGAYTRDGGSTGFKNPYSVGGRSALHVGRFSGSNNKGGGSNGGPQSDMGTGVSANGSATMNGAGAKQVASVSGSSGRGARAGDERRYVDKNGFRTSEFQGDQYYKGGDKENPNEKILSALKKGDKKRKGGKGGKDGKDDLKNLMAKLPKYKKSKLDKTMRLTRDIANANAEKLSHLIKNQRNKEIGTGIRPVFSTAVQVYDTLSLDDEGLIVVED